MPEEPVLNLEFSQDKERALSWESFPHPNALLQWLVQHLFVNTAKIQTSSQIILSAAKPSAADATKLWLKTSEPYAIGFVAGGSYKMFWQFPDTSPFLWTKTNQGLPQGVTQLTVSELTKFSLSNPANLSNGFWVIFRPPAI
jgi:hypothetical protein